MAEVRVSFLGTGAGNCIHRAHTAIVLDCPDGTRLLLDAGSGNSVLRHGAQLDFFAEDYEHVLLSHRHGDHMGGLPHIQGRRTQIAPTASPLVVHSLEESLAGLQNLFRAVSITHQVDEDSVTTSDGNRVVAWDPVELGQWITLGADTRASCFLVNHIGGAVGWRVETGGISVVFSGDTRYSESLVEASQGADLLIHEALSTDEDREGAASRGHCTAGEAARAAALADAGQLVITHIDTPFHHNPQPLADEARAHYGGPVSVAEDLWVTTVSSP
ncbi:MAG: MBL fold metallo-hydrolase [Chloroflexota bacterium]|nr:MBL fold metallo-hydrolase [Chloroflexota bacterium]